MFENYPDPNKVKKAEQAYQPQRGGVDGLVLVLAWMAFVVLAVFAATDNTPTPAASSGAPAAQVLITATPTAVPSPTATAPRMVEEIVPTPNPNARGVVTLRPTGATALKISYRQNGTMQEIAECAPVPYTQICEILRPATNDGFVISVWDGQGWTHLPAEGDKDYLVIVGEQMYHIEEQP
jgi:hypothetical protein